MPARALVMGPTATPEQPGNGAASNTTVRPRPPGLTRPRRSAIATGPSVISPNTIAAVRDRSDIIAVIAEAVPSLKKKGRTYLGLCPFHQEKTPSFNVNPDRGFYHCFGCKEGGTIIDFVMKNEGASFPEAVRSLAERFNIPVEEDRAAAPGEHDRMKRQRDEYLAATQIAATFYEAQLHEHEHRRFALEELACRGLAFGRDAAMDEALRAFRVGYAPPGWDALALHLRAQGVSPIAAETVGLLVPRSSGTGHYDRFRHRLMFAVTDAQGRVVAFSGRVLEPLPGSEPAEKGAKYINSPESPIYTKGHHLFGLFQARHKIRAVEEAIVVEGNFDALSLHARGVDNVVALLGTAFTPDQARLLHRFTPKAAFLLDGDAAGRKAVHAMRPTVKAAGLTARVARLPEGVDPDELVRSGGRAALEGVIGRATGLAEFLLDAALDARFSSANAGERAERIDEVVRLLREEDDPLRRAMWKAYVDQLAARLDIRDVASFHALEARVRRDLAVEVQARGPRPEDARVRASDPGSHERRAILDALIEWPVLLFDPDLEETLALLQGPLVPIVKGLRDAWSHERNQLDTEQFLKSVPDSHRGHCARVLSTARFFDAAEAKGCLLKNANKLKRLLLSQETHELAKENYVETGDPETETERATEALLRQRRKHGLKE